MQRPSLIVLDLDGTLVDSRRDLANAANRLVAELGGTPLTVQQVVAMVGEGVQVLVERVVAAACATAAADPALVDRFRALYGKDLLRHTRPYPGVVELLDRLRDRVPLAVLTNKPLEPAERILDGLGLRDRFVRVVGGDGPWPRKPDPESLRWLMRDSDAGTAVLMGDSGVDRATAHAAAVPFALAGWGFGVDTVEPGSLRGDDLILEHPARLATLLGL